MMIFKRIYQVLDDYIFVYFKNDRILRKGQVIRPTDIKAYRQAVILFIVVNMLIAFFIFLHSMKEPSLLLALKKLIVDIKTNSFERKAHLIVYLIDFVVSVGGTGAVFYVLILPAIDYKTRLANLIQARQYYVANRMIETVDDPLVRFFKGNKIVKLDYLYYPKFYIKLDRLQMITLTILLDGSRYQDEYLNMMEHVEPVFNAQCVYKGQRGQYIQYKLIPKKFIRRLTVNEAFLNRKVKDKYKIELMKGYVWDIIKSPHGLITGATGGGKTFLIFYLLREMIKRGYEVVLLDPKMSDLASLKSILGRDHVADTTPQILGKLRRAEEVMNERYIAMQNSEKQKIGANFTHYDYAPVWIIFDEFMAFFESCTPEERKEADRRTKNIVLKGRQAGVFILYTTQRADASALSGAIRDQLGLRVALGKMSVDGYRMVFGTTDKQFIEPVVFGVGYITIQGQTNIIQDFYTPLFTDNYSIQDDLIELVKDNSAYNNEVVA